MTLPEFPEHHTLKYLTIEQRKEIELYLHSQGFLSFFVLVSKK